MLDFTFSNLTLLLLELLYLSGCDLGHDCPQTLFLLFFIGFACNIIIWISRVGVVYSIMAFLLVMRGETDWWALKEFDFTQFDIASEILVTSVIIPQHFPLNINNISC